MYIIYLVLCSMYDTHTHTHTYIHTHTFPGEQNRTFQLLLLSRDVCCLPIGSLFYVLVTLSYKQHRVVSCWGVDTGYSSPDEKHFVLAFFIIIIIIIIINIPSHRHNDIFPTNDIFRIFYIHSKFISYFMLPACTESSTNFTYHNIPPHYWLSTELGTNDVVWDL